MRHKKNYKQGRFCALLLVIILVISSMTTAYGQNTRRAAKVLELKGTVNIMKAGGENPLKAFKGMSLTQGDQVITGRSASARLELDEATEVRIGENTKVFVSELVESVQAQTEKSTFSLKSGGVWVDIKKKLNVGSKMEVKTPVAVMGVRGTEFYTRHFGNTTEVSAFSGSIAVTFDTFTRNPDGTIAPSSVEVVLQENQQITLEKSTDGAIQHTTGDLDIEKLDLFALEILKEMIEDNPEALSEKVKENIDEVMMRKMEERKEEDKRTQELQQQLLQESARRIYEQTPAPPPSSGGGSSSIATISINAIDDITMDLGDSREINVTTTPRDITLKAESSNANVANVTVDSTTLKVTGKAAGIATITVTASRPNFHGSSRQFTVVVTEDLQQGKIVDIKVATQPAKINYSIGEALNLIGLTITVNYENASSQVIQVTPNMVSGFNSTSPGEQAVTITYKDYSTVFYIVVEEPLAQEPQLTGIELTGQPEKIHYYVDEELNLGDLVAIVKYSDGSSEAIKVTHDMISGFNSELAGEQAVTITYKGYSTVFYVMVKETPASEPQLMGIEITKGPNKTNYSEDEELKLEGLVVIAKYDDGSSEEIEVTLDMVSGFNSGLVGEQAVTITYKGYSTVFYVVVEEPPAPEPQLTGIEITRQPRKIDYNIGEELELEGLVVIAKYDDGSIEEVEVTTNMVSGFSSRLAGEQAVTITYEGYSVVFYVVVEEPPAPEPQLTGIEITRQPRKIDYNIGEELELEGLVVIAKYDDGSIEEVEVTSNMISGFSSRVAGEQAVTITYKGYTTVFYIFVNETPPDIITPELVGIEIVEEVEKIFYYIGEQLDLTGLVVIAEYGDGDSHPIVVTDDMVSGFDSTVVGTQQIMINYRGKITSFSVVIKEKISSFIEVTGGIDFRSVTEDELQSLQDNNSHLDLVAGASMSVNKNQIAPQILGDIAVYKYVSWSKNRFDTSHNTLISIIPDSITRFAPAFSDTFTMPTNEGAFYFLVIFLDENKNIVGYYQNEEKFTVHRPNFTPPEIVEPQLIDIEIRELPEKIYYYMDEELDLEGLVVIANYSDGSSGKVKVTSNMVSGFNSRLAGEQEVVITYKGHTAVFYIFVEEMSPPEAQLLEIKIAEELEKVHYYVDEELELEGLVVIAKYDDGSEEEIEVTLDMISGFYSWQPGEQEITITYRGYTAVFYILVEEMSSPGVPEARSITKVASLDNIIVNPGTNFEDLKLPEEVEVTLDDESIANLEVIWLKGDYDGNKAGIYTLTGDLTVTQAVYNPSGLTAKIDVTVVDEADHTETTPSEYFAFNAATGTITGYYTRGVDGELPEILNPNIPSKINGVTVASIGTWAFAEKNLIEVIIPNSVTNIGDWAFSFNNLTEVIIPNSVTNIGDGTFRNNNLTEVIIPNSITNIGSMAFTENNLTQIIIPNSVTNIGDRAFSFNNLTEVIIPNSVTNIGDGTFSENNLTELIIPNSVTSIGITAFFDNNLTKVILSDSVINIGNGAFAENNLTEVNIPNSVLSIGASAFAGNNLTEVIIPDSITSIGTWTFNGNNLTEVVIPDSVTSIGAWAFQGNNLTEVIIPNNVTSIDDGAFQHNNLTKITIGANVYIDSSVGTMGRNIGFKSFYNYNDQQVGTYVYFEGQGWEFEKIPAPEPQLMEIEITRQPEKAHYYIGEELKLEGLVVIAKYDDGNSEEIEVTLDMISEFYSWQPGEQAVKIMYKGYSAIFYVAVEEADHTETTPSEYFAFNAATGTITGYYTRGVQGDLSEVLNPNIPSRIDGVSVISIGAEAFSRNNLTEVTIPDSVTNIGYGAFSRNNLTEVIIPDSVTNIGHAAFSENNLTEIIIPNSVVGIDGWSFAWNNLTEVIIPDSVTSIGDWVFSWNSLTKVIIPDSVTSIGDFAFSSNNLTEVIIPNSITSIGGYVFNENKLTQVIIPNSVTSIGAGAFNNNNLTEVIIPDSVTSIGASAFAWNSLTKVIIPDSVTSIDEYAFFNNNLTKITIGASVYIKDSYAGTMGTNIDFKNFYDNNDQQAGTYIYFQDEGWGFEE